MISTQRGPDRHARVEDRAGGEAGWRSDDHGRRHTRWRQRRRDDRTGPHCRLFFVLRSSSSRIDDPVFSTVTIQRDLYYGNLVQNHHFEKA